MSDTEDVWLYSPVIKVTNWFTGNYAAGELNIVIPEVLNVGWEEIRWPVVFFIKAPMYIYEAINVSYHNIVPHNANDIYIQLSTGFSYQIWNYKWKTAKEFQTPKEYMNFRATRWPTFDKNKFFFMVKIYKIDRLVNWFISSSVIFWQGFYIHII